MRWILTLLFAGWGATAFAQLGEISISMGKSTLRNNVLGSETVTTAPGATATLDYKAESNFRLGFRLTINSYTFFGHELGYAYNRSKLKVEGPGVDPNANQVSLPLHQVSYNFLAYATPEGSSVRPFAAGGGHFSTFYPPGSSVFSGNGVTKLGFNYGGGIKIRVSPIFMVRFDVHDYATGKPFDFQNQKGLLHQLEVTTGLAFVF